MAQYQPTAALVVSPLSIERCGLRRSSTKSGARLCRSCGTRDPPQWNRQRRTRGEQPPGENMVSFSSLCFHPPTKTHTHTSHTHTHTHALGLALMPADSEAASLCIVLAALDVVAAHHLQRPAVLLEKVDLLQQPLLMMLEVPHCANVGR